jgi:hypothetical protein
MSDTAYAGLALVGAPALLTNATSVLLMSTANRLARSVTRAREITQAIEQLGGHSDDPDRLFWQLNLAERRVLITVRAMTALYVAIGCFSAGTLAAFLGALALAEESAFQPWAVQATVLTGAGGVIALMSGAALLVYETHLAYRLLHDEAKRLRRQRRSQA